MIVSARTLGLITQDGASDVRVVQALLEDAFRNVRLVVLRLSKSHDRLDEIARVVARFAAPDVVLLCGGNVKYASPVRAW